MTRVIFSWAILLGALWISAPCRGLAQGQTSADSNVVVLFTSGATMYGRVVKIIPNKEITIDRFPDHQVFTYPIDKFYTVTDSTELALKRAEMAQNPPGARVSKTMGVLVMGGLTPRSDTTAASVMITNSFRLRPRVALGFGLGFSRCIIKNGSTKREASGPDFLADLKIGLIGSNSQFFLNLLGGYAILFPKGEVGEKPHGAKYGAGLGVRFIVEPKVSFVTELLVSSQIGPDLERRVLPIVFAGIGIGQ